MFNMSKGESKYSRSGTTGFNGKLNNEVKVRFDDETIRRLQLLSGEEGINQTECLRTIVINALFSESELVTLYQNRLRSFKIRGCSIGNIDTTELKARQKLKIVEATMRNPINTPSR